MMRLWNLGLRMMHAVYTLHQQGRHVTAQAVMRRWLTWSYRQPHVFDLHRRCVMTQLESSYRLEARVNAPQRRDRRWRTE